MKTPSKYIKALFVIFLSNTLSARELTESDKLRSWQENRKFEEELSRSNQAIMEEQEALLRLQAMRQALANRQAQAANPGAANKQEIDQAAVNQIFITKIDENKDDVLKLNNGAVVKVTRGFLGFVGFKKDAVLYKEAVGWKIWIAGKMAYNCDIIKGPEKQVASTGVIIKISEVLAEGEILSTQKGSLFEVNALSRLETSLWNGPFDALLIDDCKMLNLGSSSEIIEVKKIR
jgi:hypothetical protein